MIRKIFQEDTRDHITLLRDIDNKLARMSSITHTFFRGIVWGLAGALGATIIAGVAFTILTRGIQQAESIPILDTLIERSNLKEFLDSEVEPEEEDNIEEPTIIDSQPR